MAQIKSVRYVFIDIVGFTKNRHIDAQTIIIESLNKIVVEAIANMELSNPKDLCIKIPTGDGLCIAITDPAKPSDIHVQLALHILELIEHNNEQQKDPMHRFAVRIAVNENDDFLVKDINGKKNVAGRGINFARRILDKADAGHILLGSITFEKLCQRKDYWEQFRSFQGKTKHKEPFDVYQYVAENHPGLITDTPFAFRPAKPPAPKTIDTLLGYFMALALKHETLIKDGIRDHFRLLSAWVLLFFLATDADETRNSPEYEPPRLSTWGAPARTVIEQYNYYSALDTDMLSAVAQHAKAKMGISNFWDCFEARQFGGSGPVITQKGKDRLKAEQPEIWEEFSLDEPVDVQLLAPDLLKDAPPALTITPKNTTE